MLKGFNYPLTPKGKSTLNPPPLWYYSADFLDPACYQYREFFRLVDAQFEGKPIAYCPYIFVDNDAALARGWTQGYPKRIGQVFQTRYYAATGKAGPGAGLRIEVRRLADRKWPPSGSRSCYAEGAGDRTCSSEATTDCR